jgi:hypothetical protein
MEVSSLTSSDFVCLVASYNAITNGESRDDLVGRGYSDEMVETLRAQQDLAYRGCASLGCYFSKPLRNFPSAILGYALILFENYERGTLPYPGSTSEQPAQVMEILGTLAALKAERQEAQQRNMDNGRQ